MLMLQGDILPPSGAKNILRQRIYSVALDYFCSERTFPTVANTAALTDDIQIMLKFWIMMHQDRKYIKDKLFPVSSSNVVDPLGGIPVTSDFDTRSVTSERPPSTMNWMTGTTGI